MHRGDGDQHTVVEILPGEGYFTRIFSNAVGPKGKVYATELRDPAKAQAIAAEYPGSARAVLFYGSCLRESELDGLMLDFYLIVSDYTDAYPKRWMAAANRLIPPNVFPFQHDGLIAKYAVLSEADFHRLNGAETRNVSVWARFAQPSRLVWAVDDTARDRAIAAAAASASLAP